MFKRRREFILRRKGAESAQGESYMRWRVWGVYFYSEVHVRKSGGMRVYSSLLRNENTREHPFFFGGRHRCIYKSMKMVYMRNGAIKFVTSELNICERG